MPYTKRQARYLLSSSSPLTAAQKAKMKDELHSNPGLVRAKPNTGIVALLRRKGEK